MIFSALERNNPVSKEIHIPVSEVLRYLGMGTIKRSDGSDRIAEGETDVSAIVSETAAVLEKTLHPVWTFKFFDLQEAKEGIYLPGAGIMLTGELARKMLQNSSQAVLLLCTLGAPFDLMLRRYQARDMASAVILDACGSAYVESGCDAAEEEIRSLIPEMYLTDRFSPGYGDLPLELQDDFVRVLDGRRRLGVAVTESKLMIPGKTVTAVLGVSEKPQAARIRGCAFCSMRESCRSSRIHICRV